MAFFSKSIIKNLRKQEIYHEKLIEYNEISKSGIWNYKIKNNKNF